MTRADVALASRLARAVGEELASAEIEREAAGRARLTGDDLRQLAARLVATELDQVANDRLRRGEDLLSLADEEQLFAAVLADVQGLGRIQPYLDDPEPSSVPGTVSESRTSGLPGDHSTRTPRAS